MTNPSEHLGDQHRTTFSRAMRIKSGILAVVAIGISILCWVVLNLIREIAEDHEILLSSFVTWWLDHPYAIVILALPAVVVAMFGCFVRRGSWLWMLLSIVLTLIPVVFVLYCFVQVIGPLYQYQSL